jgi:hypothetical protein
MIYEILYELIKYAILIIILHHLFIYIKRLFVEVYEFNPTEISLSEYIKPIKIKQILVSDNINKIKDNITDNLIQDDIDINTQNDTQKDTQSDTQSNTQSNTHNDKVMHNITNINKTVIVENMDGEKYNTDIQNNSSSITNVSIKNELLDFINNEFSDDCESNETNDNIELTENNI